MRKVGDGFFALQSLMWPDPAVCDDVPIWVRLEKSTALTPDRAAINFADGGIARFDTAFNLFPLQKWQEDCDLQDLWLTLRGRGTFEVSVTAVMIEQAEARTILAGVVALSDDVTTRLDLSDRIEAEGMGVVYFSLRAVGEGRLLGAVWETQQAPLRQPDMVIGITTFRREKAVQSTVERYLRFVEAWDGADDLHLVVVDNGQSVTLPPSDRVTLVPNRNLGGSGGFARCLREARSRGASHCLFMDDDASVDLTALPRVMAFLAYATDPATAINGGLTQASAPSRLWESGAVIQRFCRPLFREIDLSFRPDAIHLELVSAEKKPDNYYGGFWFFAFAIEQVRHWPFPFFVRGDDINFSIANRFHFVTLPGVVCFQDQDFADKESALTLYLDVRNHLIQHLVLKSLQMGLVRFASIPVHFFARSLIQMHHDSLLTLCQSVEDVMRGPRFFAENADMAARRAQILKARRFEVWEPLTTPEPQPRMWISNRTHRMRLFMKLTLNGLLLPFFGGGATGW